MNPGDDPMNHTDDERFDQAMRALHTQAVSQVSSATRARLRVARHAAATPAGERAPRRGFGWVLASGFAAVFALAIGLQLRPTITPDAAPAAVATAPNAYDADTAVAMLDESPDLYLWLASNDDAMPTLEP
ncbi:hypothetical protein QLQ15_08570 [Lysobacter sp. LF1]|uniref:DUF3619 family protein n=1 Tax=Lysobacter stagni TaxID=3045172 RepID=A0ABT6XG92_9GAMM|nr:hypothetical protein [Lysobacter sp. LF1]MDI9238968.1 hypothetical protein [Lysobacter sp. LF1]